MVAGAVEQRNFGQITKLPSGRYRARYADPDGRQTEAGLPYRHSAPHTFTARADAEAWLVDEPRLIANGDWTSPADRQAHRREKSPTMGEYAPRWSAARKVKGQPLADRTRDRYQDLLDRVILPTFDDVDLEAITPEAVAHWYDTAAPDTPTYQAHAYSLLRAIMRSGGGSGHPSRGRDHRCGHLRAPPADGSPRRRVLGCAADAPQDRRHRGLRDTGAAMGARPARPRVSVARGG